MKTCSKCGKRKPTSAFPARGRRCKSCINEDQRNWYQANLAAQRQRSRQKAKRDRKKILARRKERRRTGNGTAVERVINLRFRLRHTFGMTIEDYDGLRAAHRDRCAICQQPETRKKNGRVKMLALDHDHTTGEVRGFLCHQCNSGLGCFKDDAFLMQRAIEYLAGRLRFRLEPRSRSSRGPSRTELRTRGGHSTTAR